MNENCIENTIYIVKRVIRIKHARCDHRAKSSGMCLTGSQKLDCGSHSLCISHIFYCNLCNSFTVNIFKIYLLTGNQR